jgi:hypothetical protein
MATFRAAAKTDSAGGSSFSVSKPTGVVANDVQYLWASCDGSGHALTASGGATWNAVTAALSITNGDTSSARLLRQVAGGSEPASYTVSVPGGSQATAIISSWSGVDTTTPEAAGPTTNNPNSASPPASPVSMTNAGVTTTATNQTVLWFGHVDWNSSSAAAFTAPSGFGVQTNSSSTPAQFSNGIIADNVFASAGATGAINGTGTLSGQSGNFITITLALKDAGGAAATSLVMPRRMARMSSQFR